VQVQILGELCRIVVVVVVVVGGFCCCCVKLDVRAGFRPSALKHMVHVEMCCKIVSDLQGKVIS